MTVEYLGKINGIVTGKQLETLSGIGGGLSIPHVGDVTFLAFRDNDKNILVADRCIGEYLVWKYANDASCVLGKEIQIGNTKFKLRLLTGTDTTSEGTLVLGGEWKKFIIDKVPDDTDSNWSTNYTVCQESLISNNSNCVVVGKNSVNYIYNISKTSSNSTNGWRPVLEVLNESPIIDLSDTDLGSIETYGDLNTTINDIDNDTFTYQVKLDGVVKLSGNANGSIRITIPMNEIIKNASYGNHALEIIADDGKVLGQSKVTITFKKVKNKPQALTHGSDLEKIKTYLSELDDGLICQQTLLREQLKSKGIEVNGDESLATLIDMVGGISMAKKWASGTSPLSSSSIPFEFVSGGKPYAYYSDIQSLDFIPSIIVAWFTHTGYVCYSIFNKEGDTWFNPSVKTFTTYSSTSDVSNYNIKANDLVILSNNAYRMPFRMGGSGMASNWIAFE